MGVLDVARKYARHQLPRGREVKRRLPDQQLVRAHLQEDRPHQAFNIYFLFTTDTHTRKKYKAGPSSSQYDMGGGGRGGFINLNV